MHFSINSELQKLIKFINTLKFEPITQRTPYRHMGATIVDAALQAGLNYRTVVYPRVLSLLTKFSDYRTTCDFIILMHAFPLEKIININNSRKLNVIKELSWVCYNHKIDNEHMLALWLDNDVNISTLTTIKGVGPKTIDYLKMLSGSDTIAIDRHLFAFLGLAGIVCKTYQEASLLYNLAAEALDVSKYVLDKQIWIYMSKVY